MVSTRGVRYKFSEGERVLCYEPDPTKAKVLYDSKVLEVIESKDKRGRRTVEYLIHFQGWNSSWDRCVSEDFVLKDTEENRQLQRDLAEKSQLQLGAYLYRRERKKGSNSNTGAGPAKRVRHGFSDDGSSSSTQPDEGETGDTDSSSASGSSSQPRSPPPPNMHAGRAHIPLPSALRDRLTFDYHLVVKRGRLSRVPAEPCAAQILESFVKWFARAGAWRPTRPHDPPQRPDLRDVSCRLNLVREVADGLRVYFDFILRGHLLYKQELNQYHEICGQFIDEQEEMRKAEMEESARTPGEAASAAEDDMKSPKIPEYSHLPPDPVELVKQEGTSEDNLDDTETPKSETDVVETKVKSENNVKNENIIKSEANVKSENNVKNEYNVKSETNVKSENNIKTEANDKSVKSDSALEDNTNHNSNSGNNREQRSAPRNGDVARRLRSYKSAVSQSENDEPAPSTSTGEPRTLETLSSSVCSSGSSLSEGWARRAAVVQAAPAPTRTPLSLLLDKVAKWQIIPREGTEHLPCRVYGAIHLARLFVKLPDFLNATQMPDFKLKLILKHIDMFVQYLDEHSEWFGEMYYVADNASRSH